MLYPQASALVDNELRTCRMKSLIRLEAITKNYGAICALDDVSLDIVRRGRDGRCETQFDRAEESARLAARSRSY